jgi:glycosyltransferase involved in cell wall biosynthesis
VRRVLLVAHALPPDEQSGTPQTTLGYATVLAARGHDVTVLHVAPGRGSWTARPARRAGEDFARIPVSRVVDDPLVVDWSVTAASRPLSEVVETGIEGILDDVAPDVVHVVNTVHLPLEIPELAHARGIPVIRSVTGLEDLCGLVIPVSADPAGRGVCEPPFSPRQCARCVLATRPTLSAEPGPPAVDAAALQHMLERKRARVAFQFGEVFDTVVFPSTTFRTAFERSLPLDPSGVRVVEMGMDLAPWGGAAVADVRPIRARTPGAPVRFVAASTMDPSKGTTDVVEAFTSPSLASRDDWRLQFLGGGDASAVGTLAADPRVEVGSAYAPVDLPRILRGADVGLSMSRTETFHRVTREYLLAGMPVFGTTVGGIPDVIIDGRNGRLLEPVRPEQLVEAVEDVLDHPERLAALQAGACATHVRSLDDEVSELEAIYDESVTATVRR